MYKQYQEQIQERKQFLVTVQIATPRFFLGSTEVYILYMFKKYPELEWNGFEIMSKIDTPRSARQ